MLSKTEAIQLVSDHLEQDLAIIEVLERPWGWGIVVNSKTYLETGDIDDMLIGIGPMIVNKKTGRIKSYSSACDAYECMQQYESRLKFIGLWNKLWGPLAVVVLIILAFLIL